MRSSRVLAEKVKTEKRMVSQKDSNEQEEKAHREKGQATRRCPIPPPHALRIFFLLHVFLVSEEKLNFFLFFNYVYMYKHCCIVTVVEKSRDHEKT